jgi:hypothetical protein
MRIPRVLAFDAAAAVALLLALPGWWIDRTLFFASWLTAWWFCSGLVLGLWANALTGTLTGGRWAQALRVVALPLSPAMPWLFVAFLPLVPAAPLLYPWLAQPHGAWLRGIDEPAFQLAWHAPAFFWARMVVIAAAWWAGTRPGALERPGRAAASLLALLVAGSLAAFDLVMSLLPGWYSSAFGLVALSGGALGGTAFATAVLALVAPALFPPPAPRSVVPAPPPVWRDLGNLLLTWVMMWAYLAFMEFLIVWAEDLPREIAWFVPRLRSGWVGVAGALAGLQFGLAFVLLLWRSNKDRPRRLAGIAAGLTAGQLLACAWLVLPSVDVHSALGWWLVPLLALAFGLPVVGRLVQRLALDAQRRSQAEPQHA